jgi:hypothetical protein
MICAALSLANVGQKFNVLLPSRQQPVHVLVSWLNHVENQKKLSRKKALTLLRAGQTQALKGRSLASHWPKEQSRIACD